MLTSNTKVNWSARQGSNLQRVLPLLGFEPSASAYFATSRYGGPSRDRTGNLRLARAALSQLSYQPIKRELNASVQPIFQVPATALWSYKLV